MQNTRSALMQEVCALTPSSGPGTIRTLVRKLVPRAYVLDVTLDVTLPAMQSHYHIYSFVENNQGNFNPCPANPTSCPTWTYSGYWRNYR